MNWLSALFSEKITIKKLLREYREPHAKYCPVGSSQILRFEGLDKGYTVYNITPPFEYNDEEYLFGRVENVDDENTGSEVWMFKRRGVLWDATDVKINNLEDPFYTQIHNEIVFGGVRVDLHSCFSQKTYFTVFWRLKDWSELVNFSGKKKPTLIGPPQHKDIRPVELVDGVGIFARPQGEIGGKGIITFNRINSLSDFNENSIQSGEPIEDFKYLFDKKTVWGGVNDAYRLGHSNKLAAIGHLAYSTDINGNIVSGGEIRHYHGFSFIFDTDTRKVTEAKIILLRQNIPHADVKVTADKNENDLKDVVFIGGSRSGERPGLIKIYGGASDAAGFYTVMEDPHYNFGM